MSLKKYSKKDHGIIKKDIDPDINIVAETLIASGYQAYLVGGCLRDMLLGKKPKDFDVVTEASPIEICNLFSNAKIIGKRFKIVHVYVSDKKFFEVSTFRADTQKKDKRKFKKVNGLIKRDNVYGTISQDAFRRDFTINSLYYDLDSEVIYDYVDGMHDIENKKLRLIKKPSISFQEDPVRMLRAIRFQEKLGLKMTNNCRETIREMAHLIKNVSPYRLFDEVLKIMHSGYGVEGYKSLRKEKLFEHLFPFTNKILKDFSVYDDFFICALRNTDQRIKDELHVNPSFIYAVFLWPYYKVLEDKYINNGSRSIDDVFRNIIESQAKYISIPEFFQTTIFSIWSLQSSFLNLSKRNIHYLTNLDKFRVAYDFFYIRAQVNDEVKNYADRWFEIQKNLKTYSNKRNNRGSFYEKRTKH